MTFKQLRAIKELAKSPGAIKDALQMKRKLAAEEAAIQHGEVEITIRGDLQVKQIKVSGEIRNDLRDAFNRAVREIQQVVASKMMGG